MVKTHLAEGRAGDKNGDGEGSADARPQRKAKIEASGKTARERAEKSPEKSTQCSKVVRGDRVTGGGDAGAVRAAQMEGCKRERTKKPSGERREPSGSGRRKNKIRAEGGAVGPGVS